MPEIELRPVPWDVELATYANAVDRLLQLAATRNEAGFIAADVLLSASFWGPHHAIELTQLYLLSREDLTDVLIVLTGHHQHRVTPCDAVANGRWRFAQMRLRWYPNAKEI